MPLSNPKSLWDEEMMYSTAPEGESMVLEIQETITSDPEEESELPRELPILPVRGMVIYPLTQIPVTVGQPRSTRLVEDAVLTEPRTIGIVTSQHPEEDEIEHQHREVYHSGRDAEQGAGQTVESKEILEQLRHDADARHDCNDDDQVRDKCHGARHKPGILPEHF